MKVYIRHAREIRNAKPGSQQYYCISGLKGFCRKYDIDFRKLVKEGIEEEDVLKIDDDLARSALLNAKDEFNGRP